MTTEDRVSSTGGRDENDERREEEDFVVVVFSFVLDVMVRGSGVSGRRARVGLVYPLFCECCAGGALFKTVDFPGEAIKRTPTISLYYFLGG